MTRTKLCLLIVLAAMALLGCDKLRALGQKGEDAGSDATVVAVETATASASAAPEPPPSASAVTANEPFVPPGSCVDPVKDAKKRVTGLGEPNVEDIADLDGDGKKDKTVGFMGMGMNWPFEIYVMRGTCGHWVGEITGKGVSLSGNKSKGLKSLTTTLANPCPEPCGCVNQEVPFYFNGKQYTGGKAKDVPFNEPCDAGAKSASTVDAGKPSATGPYKVGDKLKVEWKGTIYDATVLAVPSKDKYKVHYDGWDAKWDEVVGPSRIKGRR